MLQPLILAALSLTSLTAHRTPILELRVYPGYVAPNNAIASECKVFADAVEISTFSQAGRTLITKPFTLSGDLQELVDAAARTALVHHVGPVDGPTVRTWLILPTAMGALRRLTWVVGPTV